MLSVSNVVGRFYRVDENVIVWMTTLTHVTQAVFEIPAAFLSGLTSLRVGFISIVVTQTWSLQGPIPLIIHNLWIISHEHLKDVYFDWKWFEFGGLNPAQYRQEFHKNFLLEILCVSSDPRNSGKAYEPNSFILLFIGYTISQLPWAFMGSKAGLLANLWFKPNEISLATSIASTGQILGMGLGFFLPPFVIKADSAESSEPAFNQSRGDSSIIASGMLLYRPFKPWTSRFE